MLEPYADRIQEIMSQMIQSGNKSIAVTTFVPFAHFASSFPDRWALVGRPFVDLVVPALASRNEDSIMAMAIAVAHLASYNLLGDFTDTACRSIMDLLTADFPLKKDTKATLFCAMSELLPIADDPHAIVQIIHSPFLQFCETLFDSRRSQKPIPVLRLGQIAHLLAAIITIDYHSEHHLNLLEFIITTALRLRDRDGILVEQVLFFMKILSHEDPQRFSAWVLLHTADFQAYADCISHCSPDWLLHEFSQIPASPLPFHLTDQLA
jgi:hypothetical protein